MIHFILKMMIPGFLLQGNYVTLTNMSDHDIDRIVYYHMEPMNISFQTMNPDLRCKMLHNRFAGEALKKKWTRFYGGGLKRRQIVLCKALMMEQSWFSIRELTKYLPYLQSVLSFRLGCQSIGTGFFRWNLLRKKMQRKYWI